MTSFADIQLDISAMLAPEKGGVEKLAIDQLTPQLRELHKGLHDLRRLGQLPFQDLPYQEDMISKIFEKAKQKREQFDHILLLGIGGSSLGARFLQTLSNTPEHLSVCDHLDAREWKRLTESLDFSKTLVVAISKSGRTIETMAALSYFYDILKKRLGKDFKKNLLFITDPREGFLRAMALAEGIDCLDISPGVGGRYSVLTPVGLFPAAFLGVNIQEIMAGARRMDERCKNADPWSNPAMMSTVLHYLLEKQGKKIRVILPYGEELRPYARWFSQLWSESLGKKLSLKGQEVFNGTTVVCASGPEDQHSQLQLYLEGPSDKVVTFLVEESISKDIKLPQGEILRNVGIKAELSVHQLLQIECQATRKALLDLGRPSQSILLRQVTPHTLGQVILMAELETVYSGSLYNVNPFNQPAVESIKINIRNLLSH